MEVLVGIISFLFLGLILISPWVILKFLKGKQIAIKFLLYLLCAIPSLFLLMLAFAWWGDYSDYLLLEHYGFDWNTEQTIEERFNNVLPENIERVKQLNVSYFGIGWPLKAIFGTTAFSPYLFLVFIVQILISWTKRKTNSLQSQNSED